MGDLLLHSTVTWINPPVSLGKWKKEPQLTTFGMKSGIHSVATYQVYLCMKKI